MAGKLRLEYLVLRGIGGEGRQQVLCQVAAQLGSLGIVRESFLPAVLQRENNFPTGLPTQPYALAIPHVDICHVKRNALAFVPLAAPVEFGLMGGAEGETVAAEALLVILMADAQKQTDMLCSLSALFQSPKALSSLKTADDKGCVLILEEFLGAFCERSVGA